jgi:hypothetical protein
MAAAMLITRRDVGLDLTLRDHAAVEKVTVPGTTLVLVPPLDTTDVQVRVADASTLEVICW